ncbi:MAG: DUF1844 domain-containing protein [Calditrichaeota bacterium]|nr:DUF1844 domain-containing protein [Calditrichota bacterium]MBT7788396.1 DUF1844 domain-containing protein [Calditrichota bacterium]
MDNKPEQKHSILFTQLVMYFHSAAIQQMGKMPNPVTGKIERELDQASMSIDMLDMLKSKCKGNLSGEEDNFLGHVVSELKLNYVDEVNRKDDVSSEAPEDAQEEDKAESDTKEQPSDNGEETSSN